MKKQLKPGGWGTSEMKEALKTIEYVLKKLGEEYRDSEKVFE